MQTNKSTQVCYKYTTILVYKYTSTLVLTKYVNKYTNSQVYKSSCINNTSVLVNNSKYTSIQEHMYTSTRVHWYTIKEAHKYISKRMR